MAKPPKARSQFHNRCAAILRECWQEVLESDPASDFAPELARDVSDILTAPRGLSSSLRFALPTQLLARLADPSLDARCIQGSRAGGSGNFDARSLASAVLVPFNREIESPLGNPSDPYVSNPLRVPEFSSAYRSQQSDPVRWDRLCSILDTAATATPEDLRAVFMQVLLCIRRLRDAAVIAYPAPARISLEGAVSITNKFLEPRTGGRRLQAVCVALFRTMQHRWGIYDDVRSGNATTSDVQAGTPADIICRKDGATVLAVEVKDQTLSLQLLEDKIATSRLAGVTELLFLIRAAPLTAGEAVHDRIRREYASGQNVYLLNARSFLEQVLVLVGEPRRSLFIREVGNALDEFGLDFADRKDWAVMLAE